MMIVTEDAPGVFRVELTDSHKECLDATVKTTGCPPMAVMSMWIAAGVVEFAFVEAEKQADMEPPPSTMDDNPPAYE